MDKVKDEENRRAYPMSEHDQELAQEIEKLKKERDAIILAHCYQRPEVQVIADMIGDSFQLARWAQETDASVIVLAGVRFMAETAKILNPDKTVLLPEAEATCPMAEMAEADRVRQYRDEHPDALIVSYVNTTAAVKALSDICCTSANARQVVESLPPDCQIMFLPDQNLGDFINRRTGREMELWPGYCPVHHHLTVGEIERARRQHPEAEVLVHPECPPDVIAAADHALGTAGMVRHVAGSDRNEFLIGTEAGMCDRLKMLFPDKRFYLVSDKLICPNMKATTITKVRDALLNLAPRVEVDDETAKKAKKALEKMMAIQG